MHEFLQFILKNSITLLWFVPCFWSVSRYVLKNCQEKCKYYMWLLPLTGFLLPIRFKVVVFMQLSEEKSQALPHPGQGVLNEDIIEWLGIGIWISGFLLFLILSIIRHVRFEKMINRWEQDFECHEIEEHFENIKKRYGILRQIKFKMCPCIHTPMTVHFFHPEILFPSEFYSKKELDDIVSHEMMHIKRMDICYKMLLFLFSAVYWYHPFAYWMVGEIKSLCETSCDEAVLKGTGKANRSKYAKMLLRIASGNCSETETISSIKFFSGKENLRRRIITAMNVEKKNHWGIVLAALMGSIICIGITVQVEYTENVGEKEILESSSGTYEQKKRKDIENDIQKDVQKMGATETEKMPEVQNADGETELVFAYQENENTIIEKRDMISFRNICLAAEGYAIVLSDSP